MHTISHCNLFPSAFSPYPLKVWWDIRPCSSSARGRSGQSPTWSLRTQSPVIHLLPQLLLIRRGSFSLQLIADCVALFLKSLIVVEFDNFLPYLPKPETFKCLPDLSQWIEPSMLKHGFGSSKPRQKEIANALKSFIYKTEWKTILSWSVFYYPSNDL